MPLVVVVLLAGLPGCGRATSDASGAAPAAPDQGLVGCAARVWYQDRDGDGFGDPDVFVTTCLRPEGYVGVAGDCLDTNSAVNPGAREQCDSGRLDEDCDGWKDDEDPGLVEGRSSFYPDEDRDGHGVPSGSVITCVCPEGYVAVGDDCDDIRADVHPGATEVCDDADVDEDCNGVSDDEEGLALGEVWYWDGDADGWGDGGGAWSCEVPEGCSTRYGDCDDEDPLVSPDDRDGDGASGCDGDCDDTDPVVLRADCPYHSASGLVCVGPVFYAWADDRLSGAATVCPECDYRFSGTAWSMSVPDVGVELGWDVDAATLQAVVRYVDSGYFGEDWTATESWDVELWEGTGSYDQLTGWTDYDSYVQLRLYR